MNSTPWTGSGPTALSAPKIDEAAVWACLFEALREYSSAISSLEQVTVDWLAQQAPRDTASDEGSDLLRARLRLAEAACAQARARCAEALTQIEALDLPADRLGKVIPFPIDRRPATDRPLPSPRPRRRFRPALRVVAPGESAPHVS
ncbi:MAG TPA: hypothetical protein VHL09_00325 [Dehalococcoidia bacterium]|nr:hypothetical protein [Dehalococcoidia bacterium]